MGNDDRLDEALHSAAECVTLVEELRAALSCAECAETLDGARASLNAALESAGALTAALRAAIREAK